MTWRKERTGSVRPVPSGFSVSYDSGRRAFSHMMILFCKFLDIFLQ